MFGAQTSSSGASAEALPNLVEVATSQVGFTALKGDTRLRLVSSWQTSPSLPKPTSSLLSIANKKGILAAAAPEGLIITPTAAVRGAFASPEIENDVVTSFKPLLSIPTPRISHVTFTADEKWLVICAEQGGGLAVYDVDGFGKNNTQPAFQISTEGNGIRALSVNPADDSAYGIAVILENGKLMLADLNSKSFAQGDKGPVLCENVSCVSWSPRGKQMTAGMADGTCLQLAPGGTVKAAIPRPKQLESAGSFHVASVTWLSNDEWIMAFTANNADAEETMDSHWFVVTRTPKTTQFQFRQCDPSPTLHFGMRRNPPHHFLCRMTKMAPHLDDCLIISSTPSGEIGVLAKASGPLSSEPTAQGAVGQWTLATMAEDSRRAALPANQDLIDTSPIGMAMDLSSKEPVKRPIPGEEIDVSATPLPCVMVLNHDGVLSAWWFVYTDSVRQQTSYPGLAINAGQQAPAAPSAASVAAPTAAAPSAFGAPAFGASGFAKPAFGAPGATPAFGAPGAPPAFGRPGLGATPSPWAAGGASTSTAAATPAFGKPSFGAPGGGGAFGATIALGNKSSPWAAAAAATTSESPFGAFASGGKAASSPFATANANGASSPFASAAGTQKSVFGSTAQAPPLSTGPSFGSTMTIGSSLGANTASSFGAPSQFGAQKSPWATPSLSNNPSSEPQKAGDDDMMDDDAPKVASPAKEEAKPSSFGLPSGGFKLTSEKNEKPATDNETKPSGVSLFGAGFGAALGNAMADDKKEAAAETSAIKDADKTTEKPAQTETAKESDAPLPPDPVTNKKLYDDATALQLPPLPGAEKSQSGSGTKTPPQSAQKVASFSSLGSSPVDLGASGSSVASEEGPTKKDADKKAAAMETPLKLRPASPLKPGPGFTFPKAPRSTSPKAPEPATPQAKPPAALTNLGAKAPSFTPATAKASDKVTSSLFGFTPKKPETAQDQEVDNAEADAQAKDEHSQPEVVDDTKFAIPTTSLKPKASSPSMTPADSPVEVKEEPETPNLFSRVAPPADQPRGQSPQRLGKNDKGSIFDTPQRFPVNAHATFPRASSPLRPTILPPIQSSKHDKPIPSQPQQGQIVKKQPLTQVLHNHEDENDDEELEDQESIPKAEESQFVWQDDTSDLQVAEELRQDLQPLRDLPPFVASQDYSRHLVAPPGLPDHMERVYRDITSMIDVLGINSRHLEGFIKYHSSSDDGRECDWREALLEGSQEKWRLDQIADLAVCERDLETFLNSEKLSDPRKAVTDLSEVARAMAKLRTRHSDVYRLLAMHQGKGPDAERAARANLTAEQKSVLHDVRKLYTNIQSRLARAEESISLLSAKLVSSESAAGSGTAVPTVATVLNTIGKMTRMAEARRSEIDLIEHRMRSLGFVQRSVEEDDLGMSRMTLNGRASSGSARSSRYGTPRSRSHTPHTPGRSLDSSQFKLEYSDDDVDEGSPSAQRQLQRSSSKPRPAFLPAVTEEQVRAYKAGKEHRGRVFGLLKQRLQKRHDDREAANGAGGRLIQG